MQPISRQQLQRNKYLRATSFEGKSDLGDSFRMPKGDRHQPRPQPMASVDDDGAGAAGEISPESSFTTVILRPVADPEQSLVEVDDDSSSYSSPPTHPAFYSPIKAAVAMEKLPGKENVCPNTIAAPFSTSGSLLPVLVGRKTPNEARGVGAAGSVILERFIRDGDGSEERRVLTNVDTNILAALSNDKSNGDRGVNGASNKSKRKSKKTNDVAGADTNGNKVEPTSQEPTPQEPTPQEPTPQEPTSQEPQEPTSYAEAVKAAPVEADQTQAEQATQEHTENKPEEASQVSKEDSEKDTSKPTPAGDMTFAQALQDAPADGNKDSRSEPPPAKGSVDEKNVSQSTPDISQASTTIGYPEIQSDSDDEEEVQRRRDKEKASVVVGARWAPLGVPVKRRLQTAAVLMHCVGIGLSLSIFFALCAVPIFWPIIIFYLFSILFANDAFDGKLKKRREWFRRLPIWTYFAEYFPAKLHKTHDLLPTRKYILGYHPHGIISHGAWAAFATDALGFSEKFPGITNSLVTLDSNFRLPLYREYVLSMGLQSVSKESITNALTRGGPNNEGMGRAVTIVIGGARESLEAQPKTLRLVIKERKGFIKLALQTGADLVPVLAFGENDLYDQLDPHEHPWLHGLQRYFLKAWKFTVPLLHGRGIFNYDVGLMPYRRPLNIVVGKPIPVVQAGNPENTEINRLHDLYVEELQKIWDHYKDEFASHRKEEMQFLD